MSTPPNLKLARFKLFFVRGLTMLLPTLLTLWLLIFAYGFLKENIARPLNALVRETMLQATPYPDVTDEYVRSFEEELSPIQRSEINNLPNKIDTLRLMARRKQLDTTWQNSRYPLDVIGLFLAVILVAGIGAILGSLFGRRLFDYLESQATRVPGVAQLYPAFKQITEFVAGGQDKQAMSFSRVVAVEFPRRGSWIVGFVTGPSLPQLKASLNAPLVSVYIPSTPTPFSGYVITVPETDTIPLTMTIDEALKFIVSGGVVIPGTPQQQISASQPTLPVTQITPETTPHRPAESTPTP
jgi:uncharacterized membrane protein